MINHLCLTLIFRMPYLFLHASSDPKCDADVVIHQQLFEWFSLFRNEVYFSPLVVSLFFLWQPSPLKIMIDPRQLENVKYFNCLGNMIMSDGRCTCEIKSSIGMAKATVNKKNTFHQQIELKLKEESSTLLLYAGYTKAHTINAWE